MTLDLRSRARASPMATFSLLACGLAWLGWLPHVAAGAGSAVFAGGAWTLSLGLAAASPALAVACVERLEGRANGNWRRLRKAFRPRPGPLWAWAILIPPLALGLANALAGAWAPVRDLPASRPLAGSELAGFALLSALANPWEEVGWRGFAQRRLQQPGRALSASLLVGLIWSVWHLPLFVVPTGMFSMAGIPLLLWGVSLLARSVTLAWLRNATSGGLLAPTLLHFSTNLAAALLGIASYAAFAAVEVALALVLLALLGRGLGGDEPAEERSDRATKAPPG